MKTGAHRYVVGERFTALVIVALEPNGRALVRCDCGVEKSIWRGSMRIAGPSVRSCGCLRRELTLTAITRHGHTTADGYRSPEYHSWDAMVMRCTNASARAFPRYGGRGITVCDKWRVFADFLADMGPRPAGTTLDRINNDGNYEPGNCRWATKKEQANNRGNNRRIVIDGQSKTVSEWAAQVGIAANSMANRVRAWGECARLLQPATPPHLRRQGAPQ